MKTSQYGLVKTTLIDYPGKVASTVFTFGCNLRCPYCHNPELISGPIPEDFLAWDEVFTHLYKRRTVLGGVCITGGEPLIQPNLDDIISEIQSLGLCVKLDTNGSKPELLKKLSPDYIAMDIKTAPEKYSILGPNVSDLPAKIRESVSFLIESGIPHEFRTTLVPGIVDKKDVTAIIELLSNAQTYTLSAFRPEKTLDPMFRGLPPYTLQDMREMEEMVRTAGIKTMLNNVSLPNTKKSDRKEERIAARGFEPLTKRI